ncbi:MAG: YHYH protein [Gammaproteobacteria bacterium]|nr:YHYH protein [Gammaproteobacteria bacterium]
MYKEFSFAALTLMALNSLTLGASFENNTLMLPYVVVGDATYNVNLRLVSGTNPIEFSLESFTQYPKEASAPANAAFFSGNILSIPALRASKISYQIQLSFIENEGVFKLLEDPLITKTDTDGILCSYVDSTANDQESLQITSTSAWTCVDGSRALTANGIPDHEVGQFPNPNNPNTISEQSVSASYTLTPIETEVATMMGGPSGVVGYVLNGVKIDANTAGTCNDTGNACSLAGGTGAWSIEALGQTHFNFGDDENHAHVQPGGSYHYHGIPEGFVAKLSGGDLAMTLIGWAADGFPIYARYGYSEATDSTSGLKIMKGSYGFVKDIDSSRPSTDLYALGTFGQDWEFVEGSGDLDRCNGRWGVTPEFPLGIYHYYATDTYPYFQRCIKGEAVGATGPGGAPPRGGGRPPGPPGN